MDKIKLIILREYLTRVKKKSFIVMTFVGPLLMAALMIVPVFLATLENEDEKRIGVIDDSGLFEGKFQNTKSMKFFILNKSMEEAKTLLMIGSDYGFLHIPENIVSNPESASFYSRKQPGINTKEDLERVIRKELEDIKLINTIDQLNLSAEDKEVALKIPETIKTRVSLTTIKLGEGAEEEETFAEVSMVIGIFAGIIIYFFIFMFGVQVMRGVIEEKTNRIIEVIISSVKPFQLMMGKIIGIALVGLTQLALWIVLTTGIVTVYNMATGTGGSQTAQTEMLSKNMNISDEIDIQKEFEDQNKVMKIINS